MSVDDLPFERELDEDAMVATETRVDDLDRVVERALRDDRASVAALHSIALRLDLLIDATQHVARELRLARESA
jgi:hypothetical protein